MNHAWGLTKHGFKAKDFDAIKNELESALQKEVDPALNFGDGTVAGQLTAIVANQIRQVWEMAADLFASLDANTAKGRSLDALCALTGTHRQRAKRSQVRALVKLGPNAQLPKDSMAASSDNRSARFRTLEDLKNKSSDEAILEIDMVADEFGPIHAKAGSINHIVTQQSGWLGITNANDAILGNFDESDDALRLRRLDELRASGSSTLEAIKSHLKTLDGVQAVHIEESPKHFTSYVMGGDELEICQALWLKKPLGVATSGAITHPITASNGQIFNVSFSRPTVINFSLNISIKVKSSLNKEEVDALKIKIMDYTYTNITLGDEPHPSRLYSILFGEPKILDVLSLKLGRVDSQEPIPIEIKPHELASFAIDQIFLKEVAS